MKLIFNLLLLTSFIFASSIDEKIQSKEIQLSKKAKEQKRVTKKLSEIAKTISEIRDGLEDFDKKIKSIDLILEKNKRNYNLKKAEFKNLQKREQELVEDKKDIERKLISLIAKDLSISVVINTSHPANITDLIKEEIFYSVGKITREGIKKLKKDLSQTQEELEQKRDTTLKIKAYIDDLDEKKSRQVRFKNEKEDLLKKLNSEKTSYKKKLAQNLAQQENIRDMLENLRFGGSGERVKVVKKEVKDDLNNNINVRQIGTSYLKTKTTKYYDKKTIAPLDDFTVVKNFGTYFDPIYKIKIFNESVTLQSKYQNARVKAVLDGKIVFVGDTPMLDNVVIIKHAKGIHTVYGYLSKIAPTIQVGKNIKKGYVIGRIQDDLLFEVTKQDYHIDPLHVINVN